MKTSRRIRLGVATLLLLPACAPAGRPVTGEDGTGRRSVDLITREEIESTSASNAYELVRVLRPAWLTRYGVDSPLNPGQVQVYLNQMRLGGPAALERIPAAGISFIRFYSRDSAILQWGPDHPKGVIYVMREAPRGDGSRAPSLPTTSRR